MADRLEEVDAWLGSLSPDQRQQVEELAAVVHAADATVDEAIKWGRLSFTLHDDWHHWLFAIAATKRGVRLVFHKGSLLDDSAHLLQGGGRYARQVPYEQVVAHREAVLDLLSEAANRQTDMLDDRS